MTITAQGQNWLAWWKTLQHAEHPSVWHYDAAMIRTHMPRLMEELVNLNEATRLVVQCQVVQHADYQQQIRPMIQLKIEGHGLWATCHRCTEPVALVIAIHQLFRPTTHTHLIEEEDGQSEDYDVLDLTQSLTFVEWIEEEVLLALPWEIKHETCELKQLQVNQRNAQATYLQTTASDGSRSDPPEDSEKRNPFAVLAELKKKGLI